MIDGEGDPNTSAAYGDAIQALFSVSYAAHMPDDVDFRIMPLEGLWWVPGTTQLDLARRSDWQWTAMIMQPEAVTSAAFEAARSTAAGTAQAATVQRMRLEELDEGTVAQVMHIGLYSHQGPTIARLREFITTHDLRPAGQHHEIYVSDPERASADRLRTVIRQPVEAA